MRVNGVTASWAARLGVIAALMAVAACSAPPAEPSATAPAGAAVTVLLPADPGGAPVPVAIPGHAAQVVVRLAGDTGEVSDLMLETAPDAAPDEARRWGVDAATAGGDGAPASVTLPGYALPPGRHRLTLWRGDAEVVRRYVVDVSRP